MRRTAAAFACWNCCTSALHHIEDTLHIMGAEAEALFGFDVVPD